MLAEQPVPDRESFLGFGDVVQGIRGGGVDDFGEIGPQGLGRRRDRRVRELCCGEKVCFFAFDCQFASGGIPHPKATGCGGATDHAGGVDHPGFEELLSGQIAKEVTWEDEEVAGNDGLDIG